MNFQPGDLDFYNKQTYKRQIRAHTNRQTDRRPTYRAVEEKSAFKVETKANIEYFIECSVPSFIVEYLSKPKVSSIVKKRNDHSGLIGNCKMFFF